MIRPRRSWQWMLLALGACASTQAPRVNESGGAECTPLLMAVDGAVRVVPGICAEAVASGLITPAELAAARRAAAQPEAAGFGSDGARISASRSLGLPQDGSLEGGVPLVASALIGYVPSEVRGSGGGNFFGTVELVQFAQRVAVALKERVRDAALRVGELSARRGGPLPGHASHRNGRDIDIAFFYRDDARARAFPDSLVPIDESGRSRAIGRERYYFDAQANWILLETLLLDPEATVQFVFVADHLKALLLEEADRQAAPRELKQLAAAVLRQPEEHPHDNHFHVRLYCDPSDRPACQDDRELRARYGHRERGPRELLEAQARAAALGLGAERAGQRALREPPPANWRDAVPGRAPTVLAWPVHEGRYGRGFGMTRIDNPTIPHNGVDIGAKPNAIVRAAATGLVVFSGEFRSFGNCIFLVHKNGWVTTYAHNSRNTVIPGEIVRQGEPIALVGSTGISRGPHVHFEFRDRGALRDPEEVLNHVRTWRSGHRLPARIRFPEPVGAPAGPAEDGPANTPREGPDQGTVGPVELPSRVDVSIDEPRHWGPRNQAVPRR